MRKRKRRIRTQREGSTSASSVLLRRGLVDSEELERYEDRLKAFHEQRYKEFLEIELSKLERKAKAVLASFATEPPEKGEKPELARRRVLAAIALVREAQERQAQQDPLMGSEPDDDFDDSKPDWKASMQFAKMLLKMQGVKPDRLQYLSKREFEKEQKELVMNLLNK